MANAFESEFIGAVDAAAQDFKGLYERLATVAKTLPPSHIPSLSEIPGMLGALLAFVEHGDAVIAAAAHGALHTSAALGRKDVAEIQQTIGSDLQNELSALLARASAAGVNLGAASAAPAPTAAPAAPASQPTLTPAQLAQIAAVIDAGK